MKGTRHNGRSGKDGVYNPLHNDRRFDPEHSEHIDNERVCQNIYWDCYQGYTTMEDQGKENNFSFEQIELAFYEEHYGNYVMKQNERHVKARHPDRCKGVEDVLKNKKTCPEESIYQLGTIDEHASVETLFWYLMNSRKSSISGLALTCILLIGRYTWTKRLRIFMSVMYSMLQTDMERLSRNRKRHWKNLALNFRIRKRKDQRQITVRLFLILPAGQCSWISVNVMDWNLTKNRPMEEGSIWRNRTISE